MAHLIRTETDDIQDRARAVFPVAQVKATSYTTARVPDEVDRLIDQVRTLARQQLAERATVAANADLERDPVASLLAANRARRFSTEFEQKHLDPTPEELAEVDAFAIGLLRQTAQHPDPTTAGQAKAALYRLGVTVAAPTEPEPFEAPKPIRTRSTRGR